MPWWIWLVLALFLLAMLVIGAVYVIMHALRALHVVGEVGERLSGPLAAMGEQQAEPAPAEDPSFAQPLREPLNRYIDAHAELLRRRARKEDRHARTWGRWASDE